MLPVISLTPLSLLCCESANTGINKRHAHHSTFCCISADSLRDVHSRETKDSKNSMSMSLSSFTYPWAGKVSEMYTWCVAYILVMFSLLRQFFIYKLHSSYFNIYLLSKG